MLTQHSMDQRRRLNLHDGVMRRADQLVVGMSFIDTGVPWKACEDEDSLVIRRIESLGSEGEDIEVVTNGGLHFWTSPGNTFIIVNTLKFED